jgi:hypothetical protein
MAEKIILRNVEVTNINPYICYKVSKLTQRNKIFPGKKVASTFFMKMKITTHMPTLTNYSKKRGGNRVGLREATTLPHPKKIIFFISRVYIIYKYFK